jgi:hypothetical protein
MLKKTLKIVSVGLLALLIVVLPASATNRSKNNGEEDKGSLFKKILVDFSKSEIGEELIEELIDECDLEDVKDEIEDAIDEICDESGDLQDEIDDIKKEIEDEIKDGLNELRFSKEKDNKVFSTKKKDRDLLDFNIDLGGDVDGDVDCDINLNDEVLNKMIDELMDDNINIEDMIDIIRDENVIDFNIVLDGKLDGDVGCKIDISEKTLNDLLDELDEEGYDVDRLIEILNNDIDPIDIKIGADGNIIGDVDCTIKLNDEMFDKLIDELTYSDLDLDEVIRIIKDDMHPIDFDIDLDGDVDGDIDCDIKLNDDMIKDFIDDLKDDDDSKDGGKIFDLSIF